jgi:carboxyl-terminal processing protease
VAGVLLILPPARAAELSPKLKELLREAQELQDKGDYARAWEKYHQIRRAEHNPPKEVTEGYQFCLRRAQQARRLRDKPSQALLADLLPNDALDLYADVLTELRKKYFDRSKVSLDDLFQYGVQEMRFALEDEAFLKDQLRPDAKPAAFMALKDRLYSLRMSPPSIKKPADARDELRSVMLSAGALGVKPTAVLVEFISGACNALDEYTGYLSPGRLAQIEAEMNGKYVGIGIDAAVYTTKNAKQLVITAVNASGPASGKLNAGDVIVSVDGQPGDPAKPGTLLTKLQGEAGTTVELEIKTADGTKKVKVERQVVAVPSVDAYPMLRDGVGYVRILSFQKTTPQDLRSALLQLRSQPEGLKALVLDLRGNLGGSFEAGLQVAEMFLSEGVIVHTQLRTKEEPRRASNPDALTVPLVVLVDGDTASAAEIVAGALKDNGRATLVGQPTYGKGSIQCLVKVDSLKAGLQVTVARFSSPERVPYDGHGVTPHELVENSMMMMADQQEVRAFELAQRLAQMPMPLKVPPVR